MESVDSERSQASRGLRTHLLSVLDGGECCPDATLDVYASFINPEATLSTLRIARSLASGFTTRIHVVCLCAVPYAGPLDPPPVSVAFIEQQLLELARQGGTGSNGDNHSPGSLPGKAPGIATVSTTTVFVSDRRKRGASGSRELSLARLLRTRGHQVIFAGGK
jgi:hypothetical protein